MNCWPNPNHASKWKETGQTSLAKAVLLVAVLIEILAVARVVALVAALVAALAVMRVQSLGNGVSLARARESLLPQAVSLQPPQTLRTPRPKPTQSQSAGDADVSQKLTRPKAQAAARAKRHLRQPVIQFKTLRIVAPSVGTIGRCNRSQLR